jgi:tetratricopeptide (TPR) repeat protein
MFLGQYGEAKEQLQVIVELPDAPAGTPVLLARALHHLGEVDDGIARLDRHLEQMPDDVEAQGVMALLALDASDLASAGKWAKKALEGDGRNVDALVTMGSLALERQDGTEAKKYFDAAVARQPKSGRAWAGAGLSDMLSMQLDKAKIDLERAVEYMPGAEAALVKSLEIDRNFGETHGGLAVVAVLQGRVDEAQRLSRIALRLDPMSFAGRFAQSLLTARQGDADAAQAMIQRILESPIGGGKETLSVKLAQILRDKRRGINE